VQQITKALSEAVSEEDKIMVITKMVLNLKNKMAARVNRPLKVMAFGGGAMSSVNSCKTYV
jgi:hypothetical protein